MQEAERREREERSGKATAGERSMPKDPADIYSFFQNEYPLTLEIVCSSFTISQESH